jgi:hypothetical protein
MLAGMFSVLFVAGVIGLGVYLANHEPTEAPASTPPEPTAVAESATPTPSAVPTIPPVKTRALPAAAKAAGCTLQSPPNQGVAHEARDFTPDDYNSNPPTSGTHFPTWYEDGVYASGDTPELGRLVHALEHGRIEIQYRPGTAPERVGQLERLVEELDSGYHILLFENATEMPYEVAATAWGHLLGCPKFNDKVFDALRAFRKDYVDKGPETVP